MTALVARISMIGLSGKKRFEPLSPWRLTVQAAIPYLGRLMLFCMGFYSIRVTGKPASIKEASVITPNHNGMFDGFFFAANGMPMTVAAAENLNLPFLGWILSASQA